MWKGLLFSSIWIGITIPLVLVVIFTHFEPLLTFDTSGILMLITMVIGAFADLYLATLDRAYAVQTKALHVKTQIIRSSSNR